jgi:hypothetical protein
MSSHVQLGARPAPDTALPNLRGWAAAQLELAPDAAPAQARTALARRLAEDDFVPPYRIQQAAVFLLRPATGAEAVLRQGQAQYDEEDRLRIEVDEFAAEFFKLGVPERRRRWQELCSRCAFAPTLIGWLGGLERGLDVPLTPLAGTPMSELAEHLGALFVLRPAARAARRLELLAEMRNDIPRWQAAARQLQSQAPRVVALGPTLVEELANWDRRLQQQRKRAGALPVMGSAGSERVSTYGRLGAGRVRQGLVGDTPGSNRGSTWPVILIVFVVINVLRLAFSGSGGSSPTIPRFTMPTFPKFVLPEPKGNDELERLIRELNKGKGIDPERKKKPDVLPLKDDRLPFEPEPPPGFPEPRPPDQRPRGKSPP